jgi:hypothetical protein
MLPNAAAKINEVFLKIPAIRVNSLADNALNFLFYPELYPGGRLLTKIHKLWPEPQLKESCKPAGAHPPVAPQPTAAHSRLLWSCLPDLLHLQPQYLGYFPHAKAAL